MRAAEPGQGRREQTGEGSGQCRWAAGVAAAPGSSSRGGISPFPPAPSAGRAAGGALPGGSGSGAAANPRGSRDSLGQTAAAGAEVSQAGWLPEPDIFGKFQQKQFRSFQKTGRWEKALFGLPPPLVFLLCFLIPAIPTPRSPTRCHPPPRVRGAPRATQVSPAALHAPFPAGNGVPSPHSGDSGLAMSRTCCPGGLSPVWGSAKLSVPPRPRAGGTGGTLGDAQMGDFVPMPVAQPDTPPPLGTNAAPIRGELGATWGVFPTFFLGGGVEEENPEMMDSIENIGIYGMIFLFSTQK